MSAFAVVILSPPGYAHAEAFREVAETVDGGLRALGHNSLVTTLTDGTGWPVGRQAIVLGWNLLPLFTPPLTVPRDAIFYNLEQVYSGSPWLADGAVDLMRGCSLWDYSAANVTALRGLGLEARHVPLGYDAALTRIVRSPTPDVDVLFVGSMVDRRRSILRALDALGFHVKALFGLYGAARDAWIARAKIVLNVHMYEAKVFEIVRVSYLLANHCFVVSERGSNPDEEQPFEGGVAFCAYNELVASCVRFLAADAERARMAEQGFLALAARPEAEILRAALR